MKSGREFDIYPITLADGCAAEVQMKSCFKAASYLFCSDLRADLTSLGVIIRRELPRGASTNIRKPGGTKWPSMQTPPPQLLPAVATETWRSKRAALLEQLIPAVLWQGALFYKVNHSAGFF